MFSFLSRVESARVFPPLSPGTSTQKNLHMLFKVKQDQPKRCEIQNWPQEAKHDNFQVLHGESPLRAEIFQTHNYFCPFQDAGIIIISIGFTTLHMGVSVNGGHHPF